VVLPVNYRLHEGTIVFPTGQDSPARVGLANAATEVVDFADRPPRQAGTIVKDEGRGGAETAGFLAAQKFI
jgi:hypothetical protein